MALSRLPLGHSTDRHSLDLKMGVYFNLSFWYKLIDKTIYGAWFSAAGCLVLVTVNVLFVPKYSYKIGRASCRERV